MPYIVRLSKSISKVVFTLILLLSFCMPLVAQNKVPRDGNKTDSFIDKIDKWYSEHINYTNITILMSIESSFVPFPSEIVVPPAAYVASKPESDMNIFLVVFFATLGALIGALINYFLALYLGRKLVYKFADSKLGKILLLSSEKIEKAEVYFNEKGNVSTFIGRLIPGIRQLISIPAGLSKMKLTNFIIYTCIGAGIWNTILALIGYLAQGQQDLIERYSKEIGYGFLIVVIVVIAFVIIKKRRAKQSK